MVKKKRMNLYPWLLIHYKNIINHFKQTKTNNSIILETNRGIGTSLLVKMIGYWLLCSQKEKNFLFCKTCKNCILMNTKNHPDWYDMELLSTKNIIGIEIIKTVCNQIFYTPKKDRNKIVYFPNVSKITKHGINALLKTLEEPPKNTYFLFTNYLSHSLFSTLRSRCILYKISVPLEKISYTWLKNKNPKMNKKTIITCLRINQGLPMLTQKFISKSLWKERDTFLLYLQDFIKNGSFFRLLNNFKLGNIEKKIFWLCSLLLDSIKIEYDNENNIINLDKISMIKFLQSQCSFYLLDYSLRSWMHCNFRLNNIIGINSELLLTEQLLRWKSTLKVNKN
ncbi:MAG: DNA polymerase III subunit delta' C-terminal domain-containing protein [Buchnera aphidicola (Nurudea yanoniella)]